MDPASRFSEDDRISQVLEDNRLRIETIFKHCDDISLLPWSYGPDFQFQAFSVYLHTLVLKKKVNYMKESLQDLVPHEVGPATMLEISDVIQFFSGKGVSAQSAQLVSHFEAAVQAVVMGNILIFFDGWDHALSYEALGLETRQVTESTNESSVQGPREATIENLDKNIGMLRMRIKSPAFKVELLQIGTYSKTRIMYGYMETLVLPETLGEFKKRIAAIDVSMEIMEPTFIESMIEDSTYSPFPQYRYTERTDTAAAALLEGKIIVMTQGSPSILICPGLFPEFFLTSEDYYQRTVHSSLIRFLRMVAFFISLLLPSIYIAFSTFHPELLPTVLLLTILDAREGIPFPALVEAFIMEFFLEMLREAGVRLPKPIGSAVSIVGALVIGQAAIQAHIASPAMVIVVASTAIASFAIPQYNIGISLRVLRFPFMLLSATLGGFGLMIGGLLVYLHLTCLRTLGQPYLKTLSPIDPRKIVQLIFRPSMKAMLRYPHKSRGE
ncbi:spore germination protein [Paenibacillus sp. y28]|uniref:spore germination protein n=1 Tax=Paenibacillus sp. y28 TaxID=3129110 RepID=UPI003015D59B